MPVFHVHNKNIYKKHLTKIALYFIMYLATELNERPRMENNNGRRTP
jgi:hypothetical protein